MPNMTQTPESGAESATRTEQPRHDERASRLSQTLAWVGIIAGVVFVVAVVFYSGLLLGWSSESYGGHFGRPANHMTPGGMSGSCPMMSPGGMMGPGGMGLGETMGPSPAPPATAPSAPPR
jgi:hypothetical protein